MVICALAMMDRFSYIMVDLCLSEYTVSFNKIIFSIASLHSGKKGDALLLTKLSFPLAMPLNTNFLTAQEFIGLFCTKNSSSISFFKFMFCAYKSFIHHEEKQMQSL